MRLQSYSFSAIEGGQNGSHLHVFVYFGFSRPIGSKALQMKVNCDNQAVQKLLENQKNAIICDCSCIKAPLGTFLADVKLRWP